MIATVKHPAEGVVDSDPVWLVTAPHCQRIECSGKQHAHVLATNMIGPRKVKFFSSAQLSRSHNYHDFASALN
jgi:hypothetical protein